MIEMIKDAIKSVNSALIFVLLVFGLALLLVASVLAPLTLAVEAHGWWKLLAIPAYYVLFVFDVLACRWVKNNFHRLDI